MPNETACEGSSQPKYVNLLQIHHQLVDIHQHISDLNCKLGVRRRDSGAMPAPPEVQKEPEPDSLVSVLDQLPIMVRNKVTQINMLLNDLEDNLT